MYPKLEKHCPFKAQLAEAMEGDLCRICNHIVYDLDAMEPDTRRTFLHGSGKVCVRYRMPAPLMAAALAASAAALPAMAQQSGSSPPPARTEETEDSGDIVGVMVRIDPCRRIETEDGLRTRLDDEACRKQRAAKRAAKRERRKHD